MKKHLLTLGLCLMAPAILAGCSGQSAQQLETSKTHIEKEKQMVQVIGNSFKVNFGAPYIFKLHFESETDMSFVQIDDRGNEVADALKGSVDITRVEIRPNVYMVYWSEPFNNDTTVTHVQDFEKGWVWTNITTPGQPFVNLNGPLTPINN